MDSTFKSLKIDSDTIEIKRLLDQEVLRQASFFKEQVKYKKSIIQSRQKGYLKFSIIF